MYIFSLGEIGKKMLPSSEKKRCQPKSKKLLFTGNSEKRIYNGPDKDYGLAEPLPEDGISKEVLEKTKKVHKFITVEQRRTIGHRRKNKRPGQFSNLAC